MIWQLAQKDFTNKFLGSYLGIIWSFFQPIVSIAVLWVVFSLAFKTGNKDEGFPFILYLTAGMIPFSFFTDAMLNGTTSITSYDYLVKKVVFKVEALPLIRIISSLFVHVGIMVLLIIVFSFYGVISFFAIQIFYYLFCLIAMILGFSLITASLNVFTRDIAQVVSVITQLAFWMTPIFWNPSNIPEKFLWILKLNPVFYIVQGYRDSLLYQVGFWEKPYWTLWYWVVTLVILYTGIQVFIKTKPHFADVL